MTDREDADATLSAAIDELRAAFTTARAVITNAADPREAFDLATTLVEQLRSMIDDIGEQRAAVVSRIYDAEATSLATLARTLGVSKTRADQLVRAGRAARKEPEHE